MLAGIGPVRLKTRVSRWLPVTLSSARLRIRIKSFRDSYGIPIPLMHYDSLEIILLSLESLDRKLSEPTQHPVEQFAGAWAWLLPMKKRIPGEKMVERKLFFQKLSGTCNHQKSHSECQGGKQLCVFIQCTEKKITCDRKVNLLRRVWKKLITSVPFNLLNKSLFISDLIIDSIF